MKFKILDLQFTFYPDKKTKELSEDIKINGQKTPITISKTIHGDGFTLLKVDNGDHRVSALLLLGCTEVDGIITSSQRV